MDRLSTKEKASLRTRTEELSRLAIICHELSCNAGWWIESEQWHLVVATKLALIHSEVSEALEGYRKGAMDDKLPHMTSLEVELADAVIRILDLAEATGCDIGGAVFEKLQVNLTREDHKVENRAKKGGKKF